MWPQFYYILRIIQGEILGLYGLCLTHQELYYSLYLKIGDVILKLKVEQKNRRGVELYNTCSFSALKSYLSFNSKFNWINFTVIWHGIYRSCAIFQSIDIKTDLQIIKMPQNDEWLK